MQPPHIIDLLNGLIALKNELNQKLELIDLNFILFINENVIENRPYLEAEATIDWQPKIMVVSFTESEINTLLSYSMPIQNTMLNNDTVNIFNNRKQLLENILNQLIAIYSIKVSDEQRKLFIQLS